MQVEEKQKALDICKDHGLNLSLLSGMFRLRAQCLQAIEIAQQLGIHRVTVSRYIRSFRGMTESEFAFLYEYVMRCENEECQNNS